MSTEAIQVNLNELVDSCFFITLPTEEGKTTYYSIDGSRPHIPFIEQICLQPGRYVVKYLMITEEPCSCPVSDIICTIYEIPSRLDNPIITYFAIQTTESGYGYPYGYSYGYGYTHGPQGYGYSYGDAYVLPYGSYGLPYGYGYKQPFLGTHHSTATRCITLKVNATFHHPGTFGSLIEISENDDFSDSIVVPFSDPIEYRLSCGNGLKDLKIRIYDQFGRVSKVACDRIFLSMPIPNLSVYPLVNLELIGNTLLIAGQKTEGTSVHLDGNEIISANDSPDWSYSVTLVNGINIFTFASVLKDCTVSSEAVLNVDHTIVDETSSTIQILSPSFEIPCSNDVPRLIFNLFDENGNPIDQNTLNQAVDGYASYGYDYGYAYGYGDAKEVLVFLDGERIKGDVINTPTSGTGVIVDGDYSLQYYSQLDIRLTLTYLRVAFNVKCVEASNLCWTDLTDFVTNYHFVRVDSGASSEDCTLTPITNTTGIFPSPSSILIATTEPTFADAFGLYPFSEGLFGI